MHSISFSIPHIGSAGSSLAEASVVDGEFSKCLDTLRRDYPKTDLILGSPECTFLLPRVFSVGSDLTENARAAEALLNCLCAIDLAYLQFRGGRVQPLYANPLRYDRTVVWDTTPALYARNYGDCKSLVGTRYAEYRFAGQEARPMFRFMPPNMSHDGEFQYHIVLLTARGHEDPSKLKGMGENEWAYFKKAPQDSRAQSTKLPSISGVHRRGLFSRIFGL